jgi:hypothetical protein
MDELEQFLNKPWYNLFSNIATVLEMNKVNLNNIYFVTTPGYSVCLSNDGKFIFDYPALVYSKACTRKVIIEKINYKYLFNNLYNKQSSNFTDNNLSVQTKYLNALTYKIKKDDNENVFESFKKTVDNINKNHAIFLYASEDFLKNLEENNLARFTKLELR